MKWFKWFKNKPELPHYTKSQYDAWFKIGTAWVWVPEGTEIIWGKAVTKDARPN